MSFLNKAKIIWDKHADIAILNKNIAPYKIFVILIFLYSTCVS